MEDILIIDNFLTNRYFKAVQNTFLSSMFDWYYHDDVDNGLSTNKFNYGYYHMLLDVNGNKSKYSDLMVSFLCQNLDLNPDLSTVIRSRMDMTTSRKDKHRFIPHIDIGNLEQTHYTSVFYLNESDGDTIIYNETTFLSDGIPEKLTVKKTVSPVPNRLVFFKGNFIHAGHAPNMYNRRVIINSNFK
jgi:hypothetical protein